MVGGKPTFYSKTNELRDGKTTITTHYAWDDEGGKWDATWRRIETPSDPDGEVFDYTYPALPQNSLYILRADYQGVAWMTDSYSREYESTQIQELFDPETNEWTVGLDGGYSYQNKGEISPDKSVYTESRRTIRSGKESEDIFVCTRDSEHRLTSTIQNSTNSNYTYSENQTFEYNGDGQLSRYSSSRDDSMYGFDSGTYNYYWGTLTGVTDIRADESSAPSYNLSGQRVLPGYKGIVVQRGHKRVSR